MPDVARVGVDTVGGGIILGPGKSSIKVNGSTVSVLGDLVASHGTGPHVAATIITASGSVDASSVGVVRKGDLASCGHTVDTGSTDVSAGG